jgi:hypothetical protein
MTNKLALAFEELEKDQGRDATDRQNGQNQKADEKQFDCQKHV